MKKLWVKLGEVRIYLLISLAVFWIIFLLPWILKGLDVVREFYLQYAGWIKGL